MLIIIVLLALMFPIKAHAYLSAQPKDKTPKVAVVLSGGGAKGAAHVGALKVIEEAGVPVDMIIGTSMGAIIGGLYSVGHTPECLDSILKSQDWASIFTDKKKELEQSFLAREREEKYIITLPLERGARQDSLQSINSRAGFIEGRNIVKMFQKLIAPQYKGDIQFDALPTRFACVAVDIVSGKEIIFHSGNLETAIRSSMSIPGVFQPVRKDNMLLIDGGILNNYPVDIAREMGADIVIGVNVGEGMLNADRLKSVMDIANQVTGIYEAKKRNKNIQDTDIYIKVDTKGYTMASFTNEAIDTLIRRGEEAAYSQIDKLKDLANKLGGNAKQMEGRGNHYEDSDSSHINTDEYTFEPFPADAISLGANFNQEEMASLIVQTYKTLPFMKKPTQAGATIRLGKRYKFRANVTTMLKKELYLDFNYEVGYNDIRFNKENKSFANTTFSDNLLSVSINNSLRWARLDCGIRFNNYNFKSLLIEKDHTTDHFTDNMDGSHNYWNFFAKLGVNTTNKKLFATKGMKLKAEANIFRGHDIAQSSKNTIYAASFSGIFHFPISQRFCLIPSLYYRSLNEHSYIYGISNIVGGEWDSHYLDTQMPFYGLSYIECLDRTIAIARIQARCRLGKSHYITGTFNIGNDGDGIKYLTKTTPMVGYGINYSYDSLIGPLGITLSGSNVNSDPNLLISLGYIF